MCVCVCVCVRVCVRTCVRACFGRGESTSRAMKESVVQVSMHA